MPAIKILKRPNVSKPATPVAGKPGRPLARTPAVAPRPVPSVAVSVVTLPKRGPGRPPKALQTNGAPHVAPAPPVDVRELTKAIAEMKTTIAAQAQQIAKLRPRNSRSLSEILSDDATANVPRTDWRIKGGYVGAEINISQFNRGKNGVITLEPERPAIACIAAMPTADDVGGEGPNERACGALALYFAEGKPNEDGDRVFVGTPTYVNEHELAAVWSE